MDTRDLFVAATDGYPLAATCFDPKPDPPRATVIIQSATAVSRRYYGRLAGFLAESGFRVLSFDYRGVGGSRPQRLRGFQAGMRDWAEKDAAGVLNWALERWPGEPVLIVGHSFGGQAVGLLPRVERVRAIVMVGAQSGYWGHWSGWRRGAFRALWTVGVPLASRLFGFVPGRLTGAGEDLPGGVAREWARWCRHPEYLLGVEPAWRGAFARVTAPVLAYSFSDDTYATDSSVAALLRAYQRARVERRHLRPRELGASRVGHWGFFRSRFCDTLWRDAREWLLAQAAVARAES